MKTANNDYKCGPPTRGGRLRLALVAWLAWTACALAEAAPDAARTPRPRVGLVLSGGGALGLAHVGVLKVLEELRIPVHALAGTSMGAVVGAAYASGMSPPEMERRLRATAWEQEFSDQPPRAEQSVLRKQLEAAGLWRLEFGVSRGLPSLPKGAISGQQLLRTLRSFVHEPPDGNFDHLPIPFRAASTDIETGELVVLSRGDLARAMRASLSIPGVMAPEEIEGRILVDGMLVRNLPVDVARAMGVDVVIAVNLGAKLLKREDLQNAVGVSLQMINILTEQNVTRSLSELGGGDVLVEPDLLGFTAVDFNRFEDIVARGEAAARARAPALSRLSLSEEEYEAFRLIQAERLRPPPPARRMVVDTASLRFVNPAAVAAALRTADGRIPEDAELATNVARLYGRGDLDRIDYRFEQRNGERSLLVETREKPRGPDYLRIGLALWTDLDGEGRFSAQLFYNRSWLNRLGGEWRNRAQVGFNPFLRSELFQPLDLQGRFFVAPRLELGERLHDVYVEGTRIAQYLVRRGGVGLDAGTSFEPWGELRLGVYTGRATASPSVALPFFASVAEDVGNVNLRGFYDRLDNINFPTSGGAGSFTLLRSAPALGAERSYTRGDIELTQAFGYRANGLVLGLRAGRAWSGSLPFYDWYALGGLFNLSGYPQVSLVGDGVVLGRAIYHRRIDRIPALMDGFFWGGSLEAGSITGQRLGPPEGSGLTLAGSLFLAADTALGPVYLAWGRAEQGRDAFYLMLGRQQ
jgi:NTE family protein